MSILIRKKTDSDHEAMLEVASELVNTDTEKKWFTEEATHTMRNAFPLHSGYVAQEDRRVIGFTTYAKEELRWFPLGRAVWTLTWMGVRSARHRQGIGRSMLTAIVSELRANGVDDFFVETVSRREDYPPYLQRVAFYEAMGFQPYQEADFGHEEPRCWMMLYRMQLQEIDGAVL
jgi:GNAT superfamily N-acetyltransferase